MFTETFDIHACDPAWRTPARVAVSQKQQKMDPATVVFLLGGTGGLAYIGLTILILSEVGQNRQKEAKLSWKKVWENFE